jgi:hypothetical protein
MSEDNPIISMLDLDSLKDTSVRFFIDSFAKEKDQTKLMKLLSYIVSMPINDSITLLCDLMIVPEEKVLDFLQNCVKHNTPISSLSALIKNMCSTDENTFDIYDKMLHEEKAQTQVEDDLNTIFDQNIAFRKLISLMNEHEYNTILYLFYVMLLPCHYPPFKSYTKIYEMKRRFFETLLRRMNNSANFNKEVDAIASESLTDLKYQIRESV